MFLFLFVRGGGGGQFGSFGAQRVGGFEVEGFGVLRLVGRVFLRFRLERPFVQQSIGMIEAAITAIVLLRQVLP